MELPLGLAAHGLTEGMKEEGFYRQAEIYIAETYRRHGHDAYSRRDFYSASKPTGYAVVVSTE
jgi:hypothetical protein